MKSHQRLIREQEAARDPRAAVPLKGARIEKVTTQWAADIILRYEWLGTMNKPVACYGLLAADDTPLGVACFGVPNGTNSRLLCGEAWKDRSICLERGACVHYAHEHAGSLLVSGAVRALRRDTDYRVVFAYSDEQAGEIGTIYQACSWHYLGAGVGRSGAHRWKARYKGGPWMSSKTLRSRGIRGAEAWAAIRADPDWELAKDAAKGKYVTFCGSRKEKKDAMAALRYPVLPYPKRGNLKEISP